MQIRLHIATLAILTASAAVASAAAVSAATVPAARAAHGHAVSLADATGPLPINPGPCPSKFEGLQKKWPC